MCTRCALLNEYTYNNSLTLFPKSVCVCVCMCAYVCVRVCVYVQTSHPHVLSIESVFFSHVVLIRGENAAWIRIKNKEPPMQAKTHLGKWSDLYTDPPSAFHTPHRNLSQLYNSSLLTLVSSLIRLVWIICQEFVLAFLNRYRLFWVTTTKKQLVYYLNTTSLYISLVLNIHSIK